MRVPIREKESFFARMGTTNFFNILPGALNVSGISASRWVNKAITGNIPPPSILITITPLQKNIKKNLIILREKHLAELSRRFTMIILLLKINKQLLIYLLFYFTSNLRKPIALKSIFLGTTFDKKKTHSFKTNFIHSNLLYSYK